jgi:hypothetical protein
MGLFSNRSAPTTPGRARVAPASATLAGQGEEDNVNNFSANGTSRCKVELQPLTADGPGEVQRIDARLPNWLRVVLFCAGTTRDIAPSLPAVIDVPVLLESGTPRIAALDVEATAAELARYRDVGRREWLETEAPLAPVRAAIKLPGMALRGGKDLVDSWRKKS